MRANRKTENEKKKKKKKLNQITPKEILKNKILKPKDAEITKV